jgi:hypothetical protein
MDNSFLESVVSVYPQPVAHSCGRICRARNPQERLESTLKAAEVLARYLAALSISSFSARGDLAVAAPKGLEDFRGPLSFGHYLAAVQAVASVGADHPLRSAIASGFGKKGINANECLVALLNLRNNLGHSLASIDEPRALKILAEHEPDNKLAAALECLEPVLRLPLFLVEQQWLVSKRVTARRLLLMGESSDPAPEEITLSEALLHDRALYVGAHQGALCLSPFLKWDLAEKKANYTIYIIHEIGDKKLKYVTIDDDELERNQDLIDMVNRRLNGEPVPAETVLLAGGSTFLAEWLEKRRVIERVQKEMSGEIPWASFDAGTMRWYAKQLEAAGAREPAHVISECLLDGRERLNPDEVRQITLLLGDEKTIKQALRREMIDCRARAGSQGRWDERVESSKNVLESLKVAIEFFGRHIGIGGATLDGLKATSGSADYIAMREGLVNLFIHQDYSDASAAGQIEITKDRAVFFNAGKSLVPQTGLVEGGRSQSRNPLLSRALRLIGFAELAGSGLREVQRAWNHERRRPPVAESNANANTFTLTLDWRKLPDITDEFWRHRLGVKLTPQEVYALNLSADPAGTSAEEVAASQSLLLEEGRAICQRLVKDALVSERERRVYLKDHLMKLVDEAKRKA